MWSNLLLLLAKCQKPGCGAAVLPDNMKFIRNGIKQNFIQLASIQSVLSGAAVKVISTCNGGHEEEWSSSKSIMGGSRSVPLVNLLIACYAFFSGLHWTQLQV